MQLRLAYFYPSLMNLYGNRGNVQTLALRCRQRGIELLIQEVGIGDQTNMTGFDLAFFGGGHGKEQQKIRQDIFTTKINNLRAAIADGLVTLTVCSGFELFGEYYRPLEGSVLKGIAIFDARTEESKKRAIGDIIIRSELKSGVTQELIGFENHSGRTYLGPGCHPLGRVIRGFGNNGDDNTEGARYLNCFGTYLHGPLLPKNPALADYFLELALERRYGKYDLAPLDDLLENETRRRMLKRIKGNNLFKGRVQ